MKYTLILTALLFTSCATTKPSNEIIYTTGFNFSEYTEKGFLITPDSYLGEYQSIGLINVTMWPAVIEIRGTRTATGGNVNSGWRIERLNVQKAIDQIYAEADSMGADAITQFRIRSTERNNGLLKVPGAEISGFAIKRIKKAPSE